MAFGRIKTEHGGAKRGRGFWGHKAEAKHASRRIRRRHDRLIADDTSRESDDRNAGPGSD